MRPERAWVRLQSGQRLNLLEPDATSWTQRDLAIGLARTYRWGGHSCWSRPLSVAQHSLLVLALRQRASLDRPLTQGEALRELLHPQLRLWPAPAPAGAGALGVRPTPAGCRSHRSWAEGATCRPGAQTSLTVALSSKVTTTGHRLQHEMKRD